MKDKRLAKFRDGSTQNHLDEKKYVFEPVISLKCQIWSMRKDNPDTNLSIVNSQTYGVK